MKFRFNLSKLTSSSHKRPSSFHHTRSQQFFDKKVESWNELREIGMHNVYQRHTDANYDPNSKAMQDNHDWDFYISQFNEQYRKQLRETDPDDDTDSISTIAETVSELLNNRKRRLEVYRRLFLLTALCFLGLFLWWVDFWWDIYRLKPSGFLDDQAQRSILSGRWSVPLLLISFYIWAVGLFGVMCATCFRDNSTVLHMYIIIIPYLLLIPLLLILAGLSLAGQLSETVLRRSMEHQLRMYYLSANNNTDPNDFKIKNILNARKTWDKAHSTQFCCGVYGYEDWFAEDVGSNGRVPQSCCPKEFRRIWWVTEKSGVPDNLICEIYNEKGKNEYSWAFADGCLKSTNTLFKKLGAYFVAVEFGFLIFQSINLVFGKQYYTLMMKTTNLKFKYYWKDWFKDIFCWNVIRYAFFCFPSCNEDPYRLQAEKRNKQRGSVSTKGSSRTSQYSNTSTLRKLPSVLITDPHDRSTFLNTFQQRNRRMSGSDTSGTTQFETEYDESSTGTTATSAAY